MGFKDYQIGHDLPSSPLVYWANGRPNLRYDKYFKTTYLTIKVVKVIVLNDVYIK